MSSNSSLGFKRFDIFKKMPRDLTEPTVFGAIGKKNISKRFNFIFHTVSVICTVVLVGLTVFEV